MNPRVLLVFVKLPLPGTVKTRLIPVLGEDLAAGLYRVLAEETLRLTTPENDEYERRLVFAPHEARTELAAWLPGQPLVPQHGADLGSRMAAAFEEAFGGAHRVVLIGTDALGLSRDAVLEAFEALDDCDLVLGPARDGGYVLIGLARSCAELFRGMEWSTPSVLNDTLARAGGLGLRTRLLAPLTDIDTPKDLEAEWEGLAALLDRHGLLEELGRKLVRP